MMYVVWVVVGICLCMFFQQSLFAFVMGGLLGLLWARVSALAAGLRDVEERLAEPVSAAGVRNDPAVTDSTASPGFDTQSDSESVGSVADTDSAPLATPVAALHPTYELPDAAMSVPPVPEPVANVEDAVAPPPPPADFDLLPRLWRKAREWLTTGNVPIKVGMIVLFAGVAALLRYTADAWLTAIPMGARIAAVALVALAALVFGWTQRGRRRVFALSMQGGAIGVLIIAVFVAFRLYDLVPAGVAFALLVVLVGATGVLALRQDALALAVLALLAGFAAPILASRGHGSHVALFAYYTLLNLAVLTMAWRRSWRVINLLGFIATFAVATAWGVLRYRPEWFASTEPFLLVNFALYLAIPWLHLRRASRPDKLVMDGCLLFGNPLACLLLQGSLLDWRGTPMALSTLGAALVYAAIAWNVRRQPRLNILRDAWLVLAGVFATLTIPLAFGAGVTTCLFAIEGAGLVWLGLRQRRWFAHACGLALQALAVLSLLDSCAASATGDRVPVFNRCFIGAMIITASGLAMCRLYHRHKNTFTMGRVGSLLAMAWVLAWWLGATTTETLRVLDGRQALAGCWMLLAVTMWVAAEAAACLRTQALGTMSAWVAGGLSVLLLLPIGLCLAFDWQPLRSWLLVACAVMAVGGWRALMQLKAHALTATLSQFTWWWRWALLAGVAISIAMQSVHPLSNAWRMLAVWLPALTLWFVTLWLPRWLAPPRRDTFVATRPWLLRSLSLVFAGVFVVGLFLPGDATPWTFLPLINPLEALLVLCLVGLLGCSRQDPIMAGSQQLRPLMLGAACLLALTSFALRGVHQWAGVPWDAHLAHSALAQLALTLVWSLAGLLAWLWGSRRGQRLLWMAGAVLMAVVLLKLLLVDRSHLGNLFGIGSFIAYGVLCTIIGYMAPAPPRQILSDRDTPL